MKLKDIIAAISHTGINRLNPMQEAMAATNSNSVLLLAPTGSGKTIAFALYLLQRINTTDNRYVKALVIAPSRELVLQIHDVLRRLSSGMKVSALYGGHSMTDEINTLSVTPDIIVATPGRLLDHMQRQHLDLSGVTTLVLDEYDKSLELGFYDEMSRIARRFKSLHNTVLTSATRLDTLPDFLRIGKIETLDFTVTTPTPRHRMQVVQVESPERDKLPTLIRLLHSLDNQRVIIFVNHRESAERVYNALIKERFPVGLYHGGLEQRERQLALDLLDNGTTPVLVATDLAARGLDIDEIGSVIHYHMPVNAEAWTHRNGRTARQNSYGTVHVITADGENLPEYITFDQSYTPAGESSDPIHSDIATLYINAGRREKISRGDIAGYLIKCGGLAADEVGRISVGDHSAIVAVPRDKAGEVVNAVASYRLKNTRVRITLLH